MSHEFTDYLSIFNLFKLNELLPYYQKIRDNFELQNSLKLRFTNIQVLRSNFVDCRFFLESDSPDIIALCEPNLADSIDSGNFSMRAYLPLIKKDSSTNMHGLTVNVKKGLPFAKDLSLENSADSNLRFQMALLQ